MAGVQSHGRARGSTWTWRPVARDVLLARAFHSCTELEGRFYLVGGLLEGGARVPSNDTVIFDPARGQAVRLLARGSPLRSHHDAALVGGRWLCVVGGWDGSRRLSTVAALDTLSGVWEVWTAKPASCPPAGLSSHTCTRISDRELRVSGREGGTRTQRRYGSIYTLKLDHSTRTYWYSNFDPNEEAPVAPRLTEQLANLVSSGQGLQQGPQSLRHHSCSVVGPFAVLFGGETLTRARDTICNDLYIYDTRESRTSIRKGELKHYKTGVVG